jgi:crotonobetainyl-CoA:carnitine CoA-transferase CaiB-like acyl-CoA transferase
MPCEGVVILASRALDDLKVVEYAEIVSGPMCNKMFADMGAEVLRIEPPRIGDEARSRPPFPGDVPHPEKAAFFYLNTSKKSITLYPSQPKGAAIFKKLIEHADILIENNACQPGRMKVCSCLHSFTVTVAPLRRIDPDDRTRIVKGDAGKRGELG